MNIFTIISLVILLISLVIHEMAHAYTAVAMGDDIPRLQGRLSMNPLRHLDPVGSVVLPLLLTWTGSPVVFGWAKPVVFNPNNFTSVWAKKYGRILTAIAGPISNIILAVVFGIVLRVIIGMAPDVMTVQNPLYYTGMIVSSVVIINLSLALFNLIPLPPLDGHHIWDSFLPQKYSISRITQSFGMMSFIPLIIIASLLWNVMEPIIPFIFRIITGISF